MDVAAFAFSEVVDAVKIIVSVRGLLSDMHTIKTRIWIMPIFFALLACGKFAYFSFVQGQENELISIQIQMPEEGVIFSNKTLFVEIRNESDNPVTLVNPNSRRGFATLSFEFTSSGNEESVLITRPRVVSELAWEHISTQFDFTDPIVEVVPEGRLRIPVRLNWGLSRLWRTPAPNSGAIFHVRAEYRVEPTARTQGHWVGYIQSKQVKAILVDQTLKTPQDYLANDYPDAALDLLKLDRQRISRRDSFGQTPLHIASNYGHVAVVQWLVSNGADVNANANDGSTSLHLSKTPKIVEVILEGKPDLSMQFRGLTFLQKAAQQFQIANTDSDKRNWHRIVELLLEAGAKYDASTAIYLDDLSKLNDITANKSELVDSIELLELAASLGKKEICSFLIKVKEMNLNELSDTSSFSIVASSVAHSEVVELLISNGIKTNSRILGEQFSGSKYYRVGDGATLLHIAAEHGSPETIRILCDSGVDIFSLAKSRDFVDSQVTAPEIASMTGRKDNLLALISHASFVEDTSSSSELLSRCLYLAYRHPDIVKVLIQHGANPDHKIHGHSALGVAAGNLVLEFDNDKSLAQIKKSMDLLRENGAELDFFSSIVIGDESAVAKFLKQDLNLASSIGSFNYPALHYAVRLNYPDIVKLLLDLGVDIELKNMSQTRGWPGNTALHVASYWGDRVEIVRLLLDQGANVNSRNSDDQTPLHRAVESGSISVCRQLLEHGANTELRDKKGKTPLDLCRNLESPKREILGELFSQFPHNQKHDPHHK